MENLSDNQLGFSTSELEKCLKENKDRTDFDALHDYLNSTDLCLLTGSDDIHFDLSDVYSSSSLGHTHCGVNVDAQNAIPVSRSSAVYLGNEGDILSSVLKDASENSFCSDIHGICASADNFLQNEVANTSDNSIFLKRNSFSVFDETSGDKILKKRCKELNADINFILQREKEQLKLPPPINTFTKVVDKFSDEARDTVIVRGPKSNSESCIKYAPPVTMGNTDDESNWKRWKILAPDTKIVTNGALISSSNKSNTSGSQLPILMSPLPNGNQNITNLQLNRGTPLLIPKVGEFKQRPQKIRKIKMGRPSKKQLLLQRGEKESSQKLEVVVARTRSGRLSKLPRHMLQDYKKPKEDENRGPEEHDCNSYLDYSSVSADMQGISSKRSEDEQKLFGPLEPHRRNFSSRSLCPTCGKVYLGYKRMEVHFQKHPDHRDDEFLNNLKKTQQEENENNSFYDDEEAIPDFMISDDTNGIQNDKVPTTAHVNDSINENCPKKRKKKKRTKRRRCCINMPCRNSVIALKKVLASCDPKEVVRYAAPIVVNCLDVWTLTVLRAMRQKKNGDTLASCLLEEVRCLCKQLESLSCQLLRTLSEDKENSSSEISLTSNDVLTQIMNIPPGTYVTESSEEWAKGVRELVTTKIANPQKKPSDSNHSAPSSANPNKHINGSYKILRQLLLNNSEIDKHHSTHSPVSLDIGQNSDVTKTVDIAESQQAADPSQNVLTEVCDRNVPLEAMPVNDVLLSNTVPDFSENIVVEIVGLSNAPQNIEHSLNDDNEWVVNINSDQECNSDDNICDLEPDSAPRTEHINGVLYDILCFPDKVDNISND